MTYRPYARRLLAIGFLLCLPTAAQQLPGASSASSAPPTPSDPLGRSSPRGAVIGFLNAARKGQNETAVQYLNTKLRNQAAAELAQQLFVVLDRRLPARLTEISDRPEGSLFFPSKPNQDLVATIEGPDGTVDIIVEQSDRGKSGRLWLFSSQTLRLVPDLYEDVTSVPTKALAPRFLREIRIANIRLAEWVGVLLGLPLLYFLTGLLNPGLRLVRHLIRHLRRQPDLPARDYVPKPLRLLVLPAMIRWGLATFTPPLLARQIWSSTAAVLTIAGCVWFAIQLNTWAENHIRWRLERRKTVGAVSILRFIRRAADLVVVFMGLLITLRHFGVNLTAALAGLGVGGIAVALAAQKTLENVIGGLSLVFDQTVQVGDFLGIGSTSGTVTSIGVRSTLLRTSDRTVVSVPNGQIATASLENFSTRDKFKLNHILSLDCGTTASQTRKILEVLTAFLEEHPQLERDSIRVCLLRFGSSSFDVEVFAYCFATDWNHFLEIQSNLLLQIMEIVEENGVTFAIPAQTLYLATANGPAGDALLQEAARKQSAHHAATGR